MLLGLLNKFVWGAPALILILGVGFIVSIRTGFVQIRLFRVACRTFLRSLRGDGGNDGVSSFRALCTALAATVGTGNLVGVAGAICLGGPGAVFWMWVCGLIGMATKFAEVTLALRYRVKHNGEYTGGPMYIITQGLGKKWAPLAAAYGFFGMIAALGVGNATQINAVIGGMNSVITSWGGSESRVGNLIMGAFLAAAVGMMLLGGARRIGAVAEFLVPFASVAYILLCGSVLALRIEAVPGAFLTILQGAFNPKAVTGGVLGSSFRALRVGVSRGVFTNEAGMGTASMAHASAQVDHPVCQGLMGIMEVFLDTIVICTMTALVILVSCVSVPYGIDAGSTLTNQAFSAVLGEWVSVVLALAMCCFAFATVLGWGLYGARCCQYLFGPDSWKKFVLFQIAAVIFSATLETDVIWSFSETVNGLMAVPNLIALVILSPELRDMTYEYKLKYGE